MRAFQIIYAHLGLPTSVDVFLFLFEAKNPGDRLWISLNEIAGRSILSIFQQSYKDWKGKFVKVCQNNQDPSLLDGFPLYWVRKGNKDSKESFRRPRSADNIGELDKDLCLFWKSVAAANITLPTSRSRSREHGGQSTRSRRGRGTNGGHPWRSKPTSKAYKKHVQSFRS